LPPCNYLAERDNSLAEENMLVMQQIYATPVAQHIPNILHSLLNQESNGLNRGSRIAGNSSMLQGLDGLLRDIVLQGNRRVKDLSATL
jgi:hypothetical protein